jgi:beta-glucosidase
VNTPGIADAARLAATADAVLLVLGETGDMSGEAASRTSVELPGAQFQLAQAVVRAARASSPNKVVIAVLMNGRPLAVQWLADSASALVESWHLGVEHGNALADVLFGDYAPSGKLPVTFPRVTGQVPIYYNHKNTGRPPSDKEKWNSKYIDAPWTPLFPFGHGLSYTTFGYANLRLSRSTLRGSDSLVVTVDVTNTGTRAGTEVAQLYLRDDVASVTRPVRELRGFHRVMLQPGQSQTLTFRLGPDDLAFYDRDMQRVVEPGGFTVWVGGSSTATLEGHFTVTGGVTVLAPAPPRFR